MVTIDEKKRVDWNAIRTEYIGGGISQRQLAKKHGVTPGALMQKANREHWQQDKDEAVSMALAASKQNTAEAVADNATRAERCRGILYELIEMKAADMRASGDIRSNEIKHLSGALKDLQTDEPKQVDIEDLSPLVDLLKL